MIKKILLFLLAALLVIQFIHPKRNRSEGEQPYRIASAYDVPAPVQEILAKACNDCHSNNTRYPWYTKLQPFDWWITDHINKGKKDLNLDEFTNRNLRYQYHKLEEIAELVKESEMPLDSYTWIHKDAKLTDAEKTTLISWADGLRAGLEARYPIDSLVRKR
jgi:hypothetical protein